MTSIASIFCHDRRAHFRYSKTGEKSRSDCAQLAEMQRILLAVSDRIGNCSAFRFQNANSSTAAAAGTVSVLRCASRAALLRGQLCVLLRHPMSML